MFDIVVEFRRADVVLVPEMRGPCPLIGNREFKLFDIVFSRETKCAVKAPVHVSGRML
ncbi:Uncharacterised protein [Burkholderia pseudomallei]|nr:Uncharacterised protein [Burkholderia pseudomallei]VBT48684.1 Uncharacterised protein [Burkholderia pseudomallei]